MLTLMSRWTTVRGPDADGVVREHLARLTAVARAGDTGCLRYAFYQERRHPHVYVLLEAWRDLRARAAHERRARRESAAPELIGATGGALVESVKVLRYEEDERAEVPESLAAPLLDPHRYAEVRAASAPHRPARR